jgi:hypothetical protein
MARVLQIAGDTRGSTVRQAIHRWSMEGHQMQAQRTTGEIQHPHDHAAPTQSVAG